MDESVPYLWDWIEKRLLCIFVKTFALGKWKETKATVDGWKAEKNVT